MRSSTLAGGLALLAMLLLSSPGVRIERTPGVRIERMAQPADASAAALLPASPAPR